MEIQHIRDDVQRRIIPDKYFREGVFDMLRGEALDNRIISDILEIIPVYEKLVPHGGPENTDGDHCQECGWQPLPEGCRWVGEVQHCGRLSPICDGLM